MSKGQICEGQRVPASNHTALRAMMLGKLCISSDDVHQQDYIYCVPETPNSGLKQLAFGSE